MLGYGSEFRADKSSLLRLFYQEQMEGIIYIILVTSLSNVKAIDTYLDIVISPLVKTDVVGEIRLIWESGDFAVGDRVVLYRSGDAVFEYEPRSCSGFIDTNAFLGDVNFTQSVTTYCTIYSAGYLHHNETVAYSCLQNSPTWMSDIRSYIENFSLPELFIPGTHDSASYVVSRTGYYENILQKYVFTQDVNVYEQLMMGVRYIDLRIGYYNHTVFDNSEGKQFSWWCNHDFMPVKPLKTILQQIKQFASNTNEIVIVDFHNFPVGFTDSEIHTKLGKFISKELGTLIHEKTQLGYKETLRSIWDSGKRVIISYNKGDIAEKFSFHDPIKQYWGNKQTLTELYSYLALLVSDCDKSKDKLWAAMAQLTPTTIGVLTDWYGGLRALGNKVNTNVSLSYRTCDDWAKCSNIVAVDFIRSTAIVRAAVEINKAKAVARLH